MPCSSRHRRGLAHDSRFYVLAVVADPARRSRVTGSHCVETEVSVMSESNLSDRDTIAGPVAPASANKVAEPRAPVVEQKLDRVLEASMGSFPASDPPGWIWMRLGGPIGEAEED